MLAVNAITSQLQSQSIADNQAIAESSHDANLYKVRHHSEPHMPRSQLTDSSNKVQVLTFQQGVSPVDICVSSILLNHQDWDGSSPNLPNKRQCRSMSIPNDGELEARWLQSQIQRRLHKPQPVRPGSGQRSKANHLSHIRNNSNRLPPVWTSLVPSNCNTPPESPRSRPSSASSGYFESPLTSSCNLNKNRCESLQTLPSINSGITEAMTSCRSLSTVLSAKSMPSVSGNLLQFSPLKKGLHRCKSQPCVNQEKRTGVKRRHDDEFRRPSINFFKMSETTLKEKNTKSLISDPPLAMRCSTRFGWMYPDRVLQTIASSPQDAHAITSALTSSASPPPELYKLSSHTSSSTIIDDCASDSGCSTTDEELCNITSQISDNDSLQSSPPLACACICDRVSPIPDTMFHMDPQDSELDLDMIEKN